jgi:hypothetical protein
MERVAFGWANLNSDENAEWGYIYLHDVEGTGAVRDDNWTPISFRDAKALVYGYRQWPGTNKYYAWWRHENSELLKAEYGK